MRTLSYILSLEAIALIIDDSNLSEQTLVSVLLINCVGIVVRDHIIRQFDFFRKRYILDFLVLPELPLPTPLSHNTNNKSLLYHHGLPEDAKRLLNSSDSTVVAQLVNALSKTGTDHM